MHHILHVHVFYFDVDMGWGQELWCGHKLLPEHSFRLEEEWPSSRYIHIICTQIHVYNNVSTRHTQSSQEGPCTASFLCSVQQSRHTLRVLNCQPPPRIVGTYHTIIEYDRHTYVRTYITDTSRVRCTIRWLVPKHSAISSWISYTLTHTLMYKQGPDTGNVV